MISTNHELFSADPPVSFLKSLNGSLTFSKGDTRTAWTLKDNAFDNATASASGYLTLGNNGYIN
ncbi:MAG: hypothetical protein KA191_16800, partial [Verrucomicrobia bacterium]|nr:hypothetical protein [Verrucomicrobiota bacterium]MDI9382639.1 hypothetical protein [Verrucomicrobiota bacterium]